MELITETKFNVGDIVYDSEDRYVVLYYHMPHVEREGRSFLENNGMLSCQSFRTGNVHEKSELYLTAQGEYDVYREGNLVRLFESDTMGGMGIITHKSGISYAIKSVASGIEIPLQLYNEPSNITFVPFWMDEVTLKYLGFEADKSGKRWSNGVIELVYSRPDVVVLEGVTRINYGYQVRIIKDDMYLLIIPEHADNVIRAVHEIQNIYTLYLKSELDISGLVNC